VRGRLHLIGLVSCLWSCPLVHLAAVAVLSALLLTAGCSKDDNPAAPAPEVTIIVAGLRDVENWELSQDRQNVTYEADLPGSNETAICTVRLADKTPQLLVHGTDIGLVGLSPDKSRIAFLQQDGAVYRLMTAPVGGGGWTTVLETDQYISQPEWSPTGTHFVFDNGSGIYVVPSTGGTPVELSNDGSSPHWSPDGSSIAFWSYRSGTLSVWMMYEDGSSPREITPGGFPDSAWGEIIWSPQGDTLAVVVDTRALDGSSVWIVPAIGGQALEIVPPDADGTVSKDMIAWAPNGTRFAYSVDRHSSDTMAMLVVSSSGGTTAAIAASVAAPMVVGWSDDAAIVFFNYSDPNSISLCSTKVP
jgi:Tol biopolymer transport system component